MPEASKRIDLDSRLYAVVIIEFVAFFVFLIPIWVNLEQDWAKDCFQLGLYTVFGVLGSCMVLLAGLKLSNTIANAFERPGLPDHTTEYIIAMVYCVNMIGLVAIILRTGGLSNSLYAPWISAQLTGILLLELQKVRMTYRWRLAGFYLSVALGALSAVHLLQPFNGAAISFSWTWFSGLIVELSEPECCPQSWSAAFTGAGMCLAFLGYVLPNLRVFTEISERMPFAQKSD